MTAHSLKGPRLPAHTATASHLVVLLHGYGADGNDLITLAPHWQRRLPGAAFVAPHAPHPCPGAAGYQWFALSRLDPQELAAGVASASPRLEAFLAEELARHQLPASRLALVGFSQGTMLALQVGLHMATPPAAIVGFSGLLAAPLAASAKPPVLLVHGGADPVIPADAMLMTATSLGRAGIGVQWHLSPELGHGIDASGVDLAGRFLTQAVAGRLAAPVPSCSVD